MNIAGNFPLTDPLAALLGEWAVTLNPYSVLLRVFMVVLLASIIGCERSSKRHSAGLRTFVLIAFSATTAMLLDQFLMAGHPTGLPLLSPTTLFLLVTTFLSSMKVFQSVDILTSGGPARSTEVFVYLIYRYAMVDFRMDRASTAAVMFFLILLTITILTMKLSDRSVTYDS